MTYIELWSKHTTIINNDTWYITDLYDYEIKELNLQFSNKFINIPNQEFQADNNIIYTVWIHEQLVSLLFLTLDFISNNDTITMSNEHYQHALNVLKEHYEILPDS